MIMLTCPCLNVRIHSRGSALNLQDPSEVGVPNSVQNDPIFSAKVYKCILDLAGITISQQRLSKDRTLDDWCVTTCICCMMDVFAKRVNDHDRVLVNIQAETDPVSISSLMDSDKYSSLFKLVLPEINDNFIQNITGVAFHNGNIDRSIEVVQSQVSSYLKEEQKAMEIRIKQFNEEQQQKYNCLLQQVRKHKQVMIYLMSKGKENENPKDEITRENSLGSSSALNRDSANESSASTDSAFDRSEASEPLVDDSIKQQKVRSLRRTISVFTNPSRSRTKPRRELKRAPASIDVGGVFDMEEFETHEQSYSGVSDVESEESETETPYESNTVEKPMYGSSLPMSIPTFSNLSRHPPIEDEENESPPEVPIDIAASIRALACSVRDGTEMFGELPRRRLNTGELLASRPF